ncbi:transcriptional regulator with XRE-family HTH domain [Azospirillum fermentarium]|uniref:helix-turn-helix domain containing protein n=1 Tax=Azospirillum fermentarium TaxID=1233114 RepID=UPI002227C6D4|nr:helix-turn-helix domain containing protein [Azospirillum fermentarium]MCW2248666.1 transcriptional regulator with XRE-family HTH domain [Azospirillum fermentarium]
MNLETDASAFHARLEMLIGPEKPFAWAKRVGIPSGTFARIWKEKTIPTGDHLNRIADVTGVSLDWLLRGHGSMTIDIKNKSKDSQELPLDKDVPSENEYQSGSINNNSTTDARLMGRLVEKILLVYKEMGIGIAIHQATERAVKEHDRIILNSSDPDDRLTQVGEVTASLRQELRSLASSSESSKRRA